MKSRNSKPRFIYLGIKFVLLASALVVGCVSQPLKAPCDQHATFCGSKTTSAS